MFKRISTTIQRFWSCKSIRRESRRSKQKCKWNRENKHAAIAKWWQWAYKPECLVEFPHQFRGFRITSQYNGFTKKQTEKQTGTRKNQRKQHAPTAKWWEWAYWQMFKRILNSIHIQEQIAQAAIAEWWQWPYKPECWKENSPQFTSTSRSKSHMRQ